MAKFRKKPVVVEAWQNVPCAIVPDWMNNGLAKRNLFIPGLEIRIATLEGIMRAGPGDWIIKGVKGEVYPCKPDIFAATYEPVDD